MIDKQLQLSVDLTLNKAENIFCKKAQDYGTAWREMRIISLADQLYIKAKRIATISNGIQKVTGEDNNIENEFLGIINYAIMGLIQNDLKDPVPGEPKMSADEAIGHYIRIVDNFEDYLQTQNPYYLEKIEELDIEHMAELLKQKIQRLKNFYISKKDGNKMLIYGALMEILTWSAIGHGRYKATH